MCNFLAICNDMKTRRLKFAPSRDTASFCTTGEPGLPFRGGFPSQLTQGEKVRESPPPPPMYCGKQRKNSENRWLGMEDIYERVNTLVTLVRHERVSAAAMLSKIGKVRIWTRRGTDEVLRNTHDGSFCSSFNCTGCVNRWSVDKAGGALRLTAHPGRLRRKIRRSFACGSG